jgi:uncharacterized protein (DUF433 family)
MKGHPSILLLHAGGVFFMARKLLRYQDRIIVDPEILVGKPVVNGTRIPVELVLKRLSQDLHVDTLLEAYPRLTIEDIKACLAYAEAQIAGEDLFPVSPSVSYAT